MRANQLDARQSGGMLRYHRLPLLAAGFALLAVQTTTAQRRASAGAAADPPTVMGISIGVVKPNAGGDSLNALNDDNASAAVAAIPVSVPHTSQAGVPAVTAGLTITPIFDSSITGDPNAAAIENTINTAIGIYQSTFSDPITVTIVFSKMSSGLGQSSTYFANLSYSAYLAALSADATTADDATALAHLPSSSTNPVTGGSTINVKTANLRAVGIDVNPPTGQPDGTIGLNTSITSPGSPGTTGSFDLLVVVEHEIDEVLGLGSSLPSILFGTIFPEDLYRYDQTGSRSFNPSGSVTAFFSLDGPTALAQFDNQNDGGDFGDWQSNPRPPGVSPKVQDAFATAGAHPSLGVELTALDVIGYNRTGAPTIAPTITTQPQNQTIGPGQTATLSVAASGTAPLSYQWYVGTSGNTAIPIGGATSSSYTTPALTSTTRYWVRAANAAGTANSNTATISVSFTDSTLAGGTTVIKKVHIMELRTRVDALRVRFGLPAYSWADPTLTAGATTIRAVHITDLRTALAQVYVAAGMTPPTYTDPSLVAGVTMKVAHIAEIRSAVLAIE
jgi:hypothetical protein